ncbi:unnamed protein product [Parnassius mnemosyne]|uniref:Uncharacterized protein n=1 Tax=Parnassius mnemosyne TaxID=213953 RepID=A0AAV1LF67_9NEOP
MKIRIILIKSFKLIHLEFPQPQFSSPKKRSLSNAIDRGLKKEKGESATARARRRRALRRAARSPAAGERTRDATPQLRPAQIARCRLILQEINRKMRAVTWRPPTDV